MKKLILGTSMMLIGFIGIAILCAAAIISGITINGSSYYITIWKSEGIMPITIMFIIIACIGIILSIMGIFDDFK